MTLEQVAAYKADKSKWARGEWDDEPDRIDFEAFGLPCLMLRVRDEGHWCGYVGVPPGHPHFGSRSIEDQLDVHGGITYTNHCAGNICHVPKPGEPDEVFWFGFDCAHLMDRSPFDPTRAILDLPSARGGIYRNAAYVRGEVTRLAKQLAAMQNSNT